MPTLELLANLGLPSAFVGMVIIALVFKDAHAKVSLWAAGIAVVLVAVYGGTQLIESIRGSDISISFEPSDACAFTTTGDPVNLDISATRGGTVVATKTVQKLAESTYRTRRLAVDCSGTDLNVRYGDCQIGLLASDRLRAVGWRPAEEAMGSGTPHYWYTNRVHAGQIQRLGETDYGTLRICAKSFTGSGEAVVALQLDGHSEPIPAEIAVMNKGLGVQSFSEIPEFYVAVREADFGASPPWAAFSVFALD